MSWFKSSRRLGLPKTRLASFLRLISPPGVRICLPKAATICCHISVSGFRSSCPTLSASIMTAPSSARNPETVLLPLPIPPVSPITFMIFKPHTLWTQTFLTAFASFIYRKLYQSFQSVYLLEAKQSRVFKRGVVLFLFIPPSLCKSGCLQRSTIRFC